MMLNRPVLLELHEVSKMFVSGAKQVAAVQNCSCKLHHGERLGIVGASGSGKTTLVNLILRLIDVDSGQILFNGRDITHARGALLRAVYRQVQAVFQHPFDSFDGRKTLGYSIMEGMRHAGMPQAQARHRAEELLCACGLSASYLKRFPHEVSGGQCQRAAIARALALRPRLLICDEATSALDVTVQRQIIELLHSLCDEQQMTLLVVSHDIALVQDICDQILVMKDGVVVEHGLACDVINRPQHPYTQSLIDTVLM